MKNKLSKFIFLFVFMLLVSSMDIMDVFAGQRIAESSYMKNDVLDNTQWNFSDNNIVIQDGKLVIPAKSSTKYTKIISKQIATKNEGLDYFTKVSMNLRFTKLPEGEQVVFAFGLNSIDGQSGVTGNVEFVFVNERGLKLSIIAYGEGGAKTLLEKQKCGISMNSSFTFEAGITTESVLNASINGRNICKKTLPVSGEGRFGILQTGSCGMEVSELALKVYFYDRPENVNIDEDFEAGEWNTNVFVGHMFNSNDVVDSGMAIEEYNGSKVLMFRNTGVAYFGTKMQYSNFELTFDIPYFQKSAEFKDGRLTMKTSSPVGLGFGEEAERTPDFNTDTTRPTFDTNTDYILLHPTYVESNVAKTWKTNFADIGLEHVAGKDTENIGYSVKFTVVDHHAVLQVKPLAGKTYTTVAEVDYKDFKTGYIKIWTVSSGNFAIDNFKLTNLDNKPNLVEVEYKSSVMKVEDYVMPEEELVFREVVADENKPEINYGIYILSGCALLSTILITVGILVSAKMRRRTGKEIVKDEKK